MDLTALAAMLNTDAGLATVRALQRLGVLDGPSAVPAVVDAGPRAILDWQPRRGEDDIIVFERPHLQRCKPRAIRPKTTDTLRVCVFGESMAAGFPLAPAYSPSVALQAALQANSSRAVEVIDLAVVNMGPSAQLRVAEAAQQLAPDVFVLMGGNNWHYGLSVEQTASTTTRATYGDHIDSGGTATLAATFRDELAARTRVMVQLLVTTARAVNATAVVVIPAVNHAWQRRGPPPVLGDGKTAAWFAALEQAEQALARNDGDAALASSALMTSTSSTSATPLQIAVQAHLAAGRFGEARAAAMAAVDVGNWHNVAWALPQVPGFVADVMRAEAALLGCACVELDAVFAAHTGSPFLDFRMFVDHCHLSVEGTQVAMAAVAAAIDPTLSTTTTTTTSPEPVIAASAWFQAAHWLSQFAPITDPRALEAAIADLLRRAVDLDGGFHAVLLDTLALKSAAAPPMLHAIYPTAVRVPGVGAVLSSTRLNGAWFNAVQQVAREGSAADVVDRVVAAVVDSHAAAVLTGIDIAEVRYADWFWERTPIAAHDPNERHGSPFLRAMWPTSRCSFITDGRDDVAFDLVARAGSAGNVVVVVNDVVIGSLALLRSWQRSRMTVSKDVLIHGVNRVQLQWPALTIDEDAAVAEASRLLGIGAEADLFAVFGEVFSLRVQTVPR